MEQVNKSVGKRSFLFVHGLQHVAAHHQRIMVEECDKNVDTCRPDRRRRVFHGESNHCEQTMADEVGKKIRTRCGLEVLRNRCTLVEKLHGVILAPPVGIPRVEDGEEFPEEGPVGLDMVYDIDLIKKDQRVEDREGRVVQDPGEDHILEIL